MTPRPAVPESDTPTPLSDAFTEELLRMAGTPWGWSDEERKDLRRRILESHESLERRLSLAQTEIKGHMRVVDELKARIAELEKELAWCADHNGECLGDHMQRLNLIRVLLKSRA